MARLNFFILSIVSLTIGIAPGFSFNAHAQFKSFKEALIDEEVIRVGTCAPRKPRELLNGQCRAVYELSVEVCKTVFSISSKKVTDYPTFESGYYPCREARLADRADAEAERLCKRAREQKQTSIRNSTKCRE